MNPGGTMAQPPRKRRFGDLVQRFSELDRTSFSQDELREASIRVLPADSSLPTNPQPLDNASFQSILSSAREFYKENTRPSLAGDLMQPPLYKSAEVNTPWEWAGCFQDSLYYIAKVTESTIRGQAGRKIEPRHAELPALPYRPDFDTNQFEACLVDGQTAQMLPSGKFAPYDGPDSVLLWRVETFLRTGIFRGVIGVDCTVHDVPKGHVLRSEILCSVLLLFDQFRPGQSSSPPSSSTNDRQWPAPVTIITFTRSTVRIIQAWLSDAPDNSLPLNMCLRFQLPINDFIGSKPTAAKNWESILRWTMFRGPARH